MQPLCCYLLNACRRYAPDVCSGSLGDIPTRLTNVRFTPKADMAATEIDVR
jgi:hypothetical protein